MGRVPQRSVCTDDERRSVLIVEDEQSIRDILVELFEVDGTVPRSAGSLPEALSALAERTYHLVVTDIRLGGKRDGGLQVMATSGLLSPDATVIVLTAYPDEDNRHASLRLGATHFLQKPVDLSVIATLAAEVGVPTALFPDVGCRACARGVDALAEGERV